MKTIITSLFLLLCFSVKSQTSDILYVPSQKSLVATYNSPSLVGFYVGGYFRTTFPQPYIYTTPLSILNRIGLSMVNKGNSLSVMGGVFVESYVDSLKLQPDIWIKINPIRMLTKKRDHYDFSLGINYMKGFRFGVGLSIPFGGIYYR